MTDTRRALLSALAAGPVPGPELAKELDVSRAAIWKHIEALREAGFDIEGGVDGYTIESIPDFGGDAVAFGLGAPYDIEFYESIGSTNERAREVAEDGTTGVVVLANEQTGGRGRLDREWLGPPGGIYASILTAPDRPPAHAPLYTLAAAVATVRACDAVDVRATIKWPNDVIVDRKINDSDGGGQSISSPEKNTESDASAGRGGLKLAGILTEMEGEADRVSWLVVGIGINANVDLSQLPPGATSLRAETGDDVDRRRFTQTMLEAYHDFSAEPDTILPAWRERTSTLGRRVRIETPNEVIVGEAVDITHPGALVVETDDARRTVHAGDCEHLRRDTTDDNI